MTKITISGPGAVINYEYYVILKALQDAGITVKEVNDHPEPTPLVYKRRIYEKLRNKALDNWEVELVADHIPWGG